MKCRAQKVKSILLTILLLTASSCGYRFGQGILSEQYSTVNIPFVIGDRDGDLTAALIKRLSVSGGLTYVPVGGDLLLIVKVIDYDEENVGFRYAYKNKGNLKHNIVPTETRKEVFMDVSLIDASSSRLIRGPTRIRTSVEFDHDYYSSQNQVNIFSLSQLSDIDEARDAVLQPLHEKAAQMIVDYINNS